MSADTRTPNAIVKALGLTGAMSQAVACGPCLNYGYPDTAQDDSGDTGDTGDTESSAGTPDAATRRVLERGVLPADVADAIGAKLRDRAGPASE